MDNFKDEYYASFGIYRGFMRYEYITFAPTAVAGRMSYEDIKYNNRDYVTIFDEVACEYLLWIFEKHFEPNLNEESYFDYTDDNFYTRDKVLRIVQNIKRVRDWVKKKPPREITKFTRNEYAFLKYMSNDVVVKFYDIFLTLIDTDLKNNPDCKYFVVRCI